MPFLAVRFSNCRLLECTRAKQLLRKHSNCRKTSSTTLPKRWNCLCRARGFSRDLSDNELDRKHGKGQWLATERFDISPSTGDLRTVDWCEIWAMRQCSETLDLDTAVQWVFQARELVKALETVGVPQLLRLKFNSDDHPYAYRWIPTRPEEQFLNMVAVRIIGAGRQFQGLCSHVASMYLHDVTVHDLASARGCGPRSMSDFFAIDGATLGQTTSTWLPCKISSAWTTTCPRPSRLVEFASNQASTSSPRSLSCWGARARETSYSQPFDRGWSELRGPGLRAHKEK